MDQQLQRPRSQEGANDLDDPLPESLPELLQLLHSPRSTLQTTRQLHQRLRKAGALQTIAIALQQAPHEEQSLLLESLLYLAELSNQVGRLLNHDSPQGFHVEVRRSSVSTGGDGLWVRGTAEPGTVLCLYPGLHRGVDAGNVGHSVNPYLVQLRNGGSVDASPKTLEKLQRLRNSSDPVPTIFSAHKANHCCPGVAPNGLIHEVLCLDHQPWCRLEAPTPGQPESAILIVTLRRVQDEEVFVDYRWTGEPLPAWYHECSRLV